jgi:SAM-dependent methyltransferase
MSKFLAAPKTHSSLKFIDGKAISEADQNVQFTINNGVVIFDPSAAENSEIKSNLGAMVEMAAAEGCVKAIEELSNARDDLLDVDRLKYVDLIDLQSTDNVLEIGASMGQHSRIISQQCKHLEALEVVHEQAAFAKLWCEQSGQDNVNVSAGGSDGFLPYKDNSFDVLIMNYVLEWCAGRSIKHPREFHLHMLSECQRVLRPGGRFFLSTKNRHNIALLLGGVDEHLGFRFGNALPRRLSSILGRWIKTGDKLVKSGELRGYLHSRMSIEQLFRQAGFVELKPFLLLPDARRPNFIESFDMAGLDRVQEQNYWRHASRKEKLFSKLPFFLQKYIAPSHVYIIRKPLV